MKTLEVKLFDLKVSTSSFAIKRYSTHPVRRFQGRGAGSVVSYLSCSRLRAGCSSLVSVYHFTTKSTGFPLNQIFSEIMQCLYPDIEIPCGTIIIPWKQRIQGL